MEAAEAVARVIRARRSVRGFEERPVPRGLIEECLELATWAPSAFNRQQWHFVVMGGASKDRLAEISGRSFPHIEEAVKQTFPGRDDVVQNVRQFFRTLGGAPVVVLAFCTAKNPNVADIESVAAACQNLLLAAQARGLGACWMGGPVYLEGEIKALAGRPDDRLVAVVPLGWPAVEPKAPPRKEGAWSFKDI